MPKDTIRLHGEDLTRILFMASVMMRQKHHRSLSDETNANVGLVTNWNGLQPALGEAAAAYLRLLEAAKVRDSNGVLVPGRNEGALVFDEELGLVLEID